jgi:two-component system, chemotaxis family, response regulator Rcp1
MGGKVQSMNRSFEILVVEDNEADVEMVRRSLRDLVPVCNLSAAGDGAEALDSLFKRGKFANAPRPHLVLLDLNMPGMNGKEVLKIMKLDDHLKAIPVVVLTSSEAPSDIRESYAHHANCYVVKRFDGGEFKAAIGEIVSFWRNLVLLPDGASTP